VVAIGNGIGVPFLKGGGGGATPVNPDFVSTWDTTQAGSASDTVILPLVSGGTYSGTIDWGDGNSDSLSYANRTHVYASSGTYTITISGTIGGFSIRDGDGTDADKLIDISNFGSDFRLTGSRSFQECRNMNITATDAPIIQFNFGYRTFYRCHSLVNIDLSAWDVSGVTSMWGFFQQCINLQTAGIGGWDVSGVNDSRGMEKMFYQCYDYNEDIGSWDMSSVISIEDMFNGLSIFMAFNNGGSPSINNWNLASCVTAKNWIRKAAFNQPINGWNVSNIRIFSATLRDIDSFDQTLEDWDITSATSMGNLMFQSSGISTPNYDATLVGWEATLQAAYPSGSGYTPTISVNFGGSQYTAGGAAEAARTSLISNFGWTITDGGSV